MIRKQKVFIRPNVVSNKIAFRFARKLADSIMVFAQDISIWTERSGINDIVDFCALFEGTQFGQEISKENVKDFVRASCLSERTEATLLVLQDDLVACIARPVLLHINFFEKNQRSPIFEIDLRISEEVKDRIYRGGFTGHGSKMAK